MNKVFIATSLDGYIAGKNGEIDWLNSVPNPDNLDLGYNAFMAQIDALIMGRNTFDTVCAFDMAWPYKKPVFVLSNTLTKIPEKYKGKVALVKGELKSVLENIHRRGMENLYIDGGQTIQNFLKEDLIDEMVITTIPYLLGGGIPLFSELPGMLKFQCMECKILLDTIVQNRYIRKREL